MRPLVCTLLALGMCLPAAALAQSVGNTSAAPITLDIQPQYPRPHDSVSVSPSSSLIDLSGATVTFYANGKQVSAGSGTAPGTILLGDAGTATTIKVTVVTAGGGSYSVGTTIRPAEVSLVAEPSATSHLFYPGGLGIPSQGQVRLVALADLRDSSGKRLPDNSLVYNWKLNNQSITDISGIGRSVATMTAPVRYRDATVEVTVTSPDQSMVADSILVISPVDPVVRVYENDPLLGVRYSNALGDTFTMTGTEDTFVSVPYFFAKNPTTLWGVNGADSGTTSSVTLRSTGGSGTANVSVTASLLQLFESATKSLRVTFGTNPTGGTGIFGL